MNKDKLIFKGELDWKGVIIHVDFFEATDFSQLSPVKQVQAVPFVDKDNVVVFEHIEKYFSLPGGTVEDGERYEETLRRELKEEASIEIEEFGPIGYNKVWDKGREDEAYYQLRYWAKVRLLDEPVNDPDGKAIRREVVSVDSVVDKLNWGPRGQALIDLAVKYYK